MWLSRWVYILIPDQSTQPLSCQDHCLLKALSCVLSGIALCWIELLLQGYASSKESLHPMTVDEGVQQRRGPLSQFGTSPKCNPTLRALCGVGWGVCCNCTAGLQLLSEPTPTSLTLKVLLQWGLTKRPPAGQFPSKNLFPRERGLCNYESNVIFLDYFLMALLKYNLHIKKNYLL